jgi:cbb3-type cytochrome oxidase cytochrome c subunit
MRALRSVGVPYEAADISNARSDATAQGEAIARNLHDDGAGEVDATSEIVALTAYLQRLGKHDVPAAPRGDAVSTSK